MPFVSAEQIHHRRALVLFLFQREEYLEVVLEENLRQISSVHSRDAQETVYSYLGLFVS